ncbi:MAG: efflux RND transporter permease subunit [Bacteroidota bacterium]
MSDLTPNGNGAPHSEDGASIDDRKEFSLSSFAIDNRISVLVIILLVALMGVRSYTQIPKEAQPDITIPNILVITVYPGVSPEDMESLVTRKLEDELSGISDVKEMTSTSAEGYSNINLEFNTDVDMDEALQKVREKVDLAKTELPQDAEDPMIQEINVSEFPIMQVNVSGEYGMAELKDVAEDLKDEMEAIPSVLEVQMAGDMEHEIKVDVNLSKLKYYGLSFNDLVGAIQMENVTTPGGSIDVGQKEFLLRVPGEYDVVEPIEDIVVKAPDDKPIYLRDVANVSFAFKDRETYARLGESPVISLSVSKRTGENIIETAQAVKALVNKRLPDLPPTTAIEVTNDQSKDIDSMVTSLENNIISGLLLVIGVLLFFLGVRNASFVGISIPMSMFLSFIVLISLGITMNMIVLFSLILALGMLVDNAIVVVENIYRYLEEGYNNFEAAKKGTGEVAMPIISGTATTLAAFLPLIFWPGIVGEFMSYLPITLIITLTSSLFVALVMNPVLCALFMRLEQEDDTDGPQMTRRGKYTMMGILGVILFFAVLNNALTWTMLLVLGGMLWLTNKFFLDPVGDWWQLKGLPKVLEKYEVSLRWALRHNIVTIGIAVLVLISSLGVFAVFNHGVEFFPEDIPPAQIYVQVEAPVGTNVDFTNGIIKDMADKVNTLPNPEDVESIVSTAGSQITAGMGGSESSSNKGTVALNFVDYQKRNGDIFNALEFMRANFGEDLAGAEITVEEPQQGPPTGKPINLEVRGKDMDQLKRISDDLLRIIENDPVYAKVEGLESNLPESRPEIRVRVNRERAAMFGLSTQQVGMTVRQAINGVEASKFRDGKDEYDITVRLEESYRKNLSSLADLNVMAEKGRQIPLSAVADWEIAEGFGGIKHKDAERLIAISADVRSNYNANEVLKEVQGVVRPYLQELPGGFEYNYTGQQEEQQKATDFLTDAFLIALFLIAFVLISQFNSISKPIIILTSVIMSTAGVLYGLVVFNMPFVIIMTGIGVISLAGVVVNNAIVLIDYIDILRTRDKMTLMEALVEGGRVRFRPVILTAITTTLGLVPLAIGFNIDFLVLVNQPLEFFTNLGQYVYMGGEQAAWWSPMAIAVIVGLIFATALTLILVPVMYYVIEKGRRGANRFLFDNPEPGLITEPMEPVQNGYAEGQAYEHEDDPVMS